MQTVDEDTADSPLAALKSGLGEYQEGIFQSVSRVNTLVETVFPLLDQPIFAQLPPIQDASRPGASLSDCDWATFISAYAAGSWDPHRTPNPPRSYWQDATLKQYSLVSEPPSNVQENGDVPSKNSGVFLDSPTSDQDPNQQAILTDTSNVPSFINNLSASKAFRPTVPSVLHLPSHRLRNSFSTSSSTFAPSPDLCNPGTYPALPKNELQTTVATMRWAASRVDISPLALPSPEHELSDPMRGVTATIPGSYSQSPPTGHYDYITTPGGTRKARLASFWAGTQDIDGDGKLTQRPTKLDTIDGSPSEVSTAIQPPDAGTTSHLKITPNGSNIAISLAFPNQPHPASAPIYHTHNESDQELVDYFGGTEPLEKGPLVNGVVHLKDDLTSPIIPLSPINDYGTMSVPAFPRRVCLARQTSSPLPVMSHHEVIFPGGRTATAHIGPLKTGRAAKEEQMFADLSYLAPPNPPDELERRRALYKYVWSQFFPPLC